MEGESTSWRVDETMVSRFTAPVPNSKDRWYLVFIVLLALATAGAFVASTAARSIVYIHLLLLVVIAPWAAIAIATGGRNIGFVLYGGIESVRRLLATIALSAIICAIIATIIITHIVPGMSLSLNGITVTGLGGFFMALFFVIVVPESEQGLFTSILLPTIASNIAANSMVVALVGLVATGIFFALNLYFVAAVFFILAVLFIYVKVTNQIISTFSKPFAILISIIFVTAGFMLYHWQVFGAQSDFLLLMVSTGAFYIAGVILDIVTDCGLPSRYMQGTNDGIVACTILGISLIFVPLALGLYMLIGAVGYIASTTRTGASISSGTLLVKRRRT